MATIPVLALVLCRAVQATLIDFNTPGDLNKYFVSDTGSWDYTETNGAGVGGSRAIVPDDANGVVATFNNGGYAWAVGNVISLDMDFYFNRNSQNNNSDTMLLGVVGDLGDGFGNPRARGEVISTNRSGNGRVRLRARVDNGVAASSNFFLTDDNWYRLEAKVMLESTTDVSVAVKLYDIGSDGTDTPTQVSTEVTRSGKTALASDNSVYSAFKARNDSGNDVMDNFESVLIPEPGTLVMALTGMAVGIAAVLWRRRRRNLVRRS